MDILKTIVNTEKYPLHKPGSSVWNQSVDQTRNQLLHEGCSVLSEFIHPSAIAPLQSQGEAIAPQAYYTNTTVNVFNTDVNQTYPPNHPARHTFNRGNAFVARDRIPGCNIIHQLYTNPLFKQFLADCFSIEVLYELKDPLAGLCLNVLQKGKEHPWHFDTNEFTVSILTKAASIGGVFQYCPNIRSPQCENFNAIDAVLTQRSTQAVKHLNLQVGDMQLFLGRYSLHRVSPVQSDDERHTAIFAYTKTPNVIGNIERTKQLFGRVLPEHIKAQECVERSDTLID